MARFAERSNTSTRFVVHRRPSSITDRSQDIELNMSERQHSTRQRGPFELEARPIFELEAVEQPDLGRHRAESSNSGSEDDIGDRASTRQIWSRGNLTHASFR